MTASKEDIHTYGLDMLVAALDASTKGEAIQSALALASCLGEEDLQRVAAMLAVETVWSTRPRRTRRALREWVELRRFRVLQSGFEADDV